MDLKTIRGRIKDGQITTVEEFERDLHLMLTCVDMRSENADDAGTR